MKTLVCIWYFQPGEGPSRAQVSPLRDCENFVDLHFQLWWELQPAIENIGTWCDQLASYYTAHFTSLHICHLQQIGI